MTTIKRSSLIVYQADIFNCSRQGEGLTSAKMAACCWLYPFIVARIEFLEWTPENRLRQPRFTGIRSDKNAGDVVRESGKDCARPLVSANCLSCPSTNFNRGNAKVVATGGAICDEPIHGLDYGFISCRSVPSSYVHQGSMCFKSSPPTS